MALLKEAGEWVDNYQTNKTKKAAITSLNMFEQYLISEQIDLEEYLRLSEINEDSKYFEINKFMKHLTWTSPATKRQYFSFVKSYLRYYYRIKIDNADLKQFIKLPQIPKVNRFPLTRKIIKDFVKNASKFYRILYLIQSSSGMRINESIQLQKEDFDFSGPIPIITIPAKYTKIKQERLSFISKEAFFYLKKYGINEYFSKEGLNLNAVEFYFWSLRKKLGYVERYDESINYKINIHSFRAYMRTIAGKHSPNADMIEAIIGHTGYLKQYVRMEKEDLLKYYTKIEPKLRIYDTMPK